MIINQEHYPWHNASWQKINHARHTRHMPHAILLTGAEYTGKIDFANRLVKSLLCESPTDEGGCEECRSCKTLNAGSNPDYMQIDLIQNKQQISIDQIREMNEFLVLSRSFKAYRVVLISNAERMNQHAANSLLKSLEEPADNSVIILVTSRLSALIATIKSRCQLLHLPTPDRHQALGWLKKQLKESTKTTQDINLMLEVSQGKPLLALKIDDEIIEKRFVFLEDIFRVLTQRTSVTETARKWQKDDRMTLIDWQISWLQELLSSQHKINIKQEDECHITKLLEKYHEVISAPRLWKLYEQLLVQKQLVHTSVNPLIFLENMLVLWLQANQQSSN